MSNKEILEKAIQKAIDGGWNGKDYLEFLHEGFWGKGRFDHCEVIFNHDFAKALWNDSTDYTVINMPYPDTPPRLYAYQNGYKYHLQQMVVSDNPIKYLGENLND